MVLNAFHTTVVNSFSAVCVPYVMYFLSIFWDFVSFFFLFVSFCFFVVLAFLLAC